MTDNKPTIDLEELIRLLSQAIEYPSPSSADPDSAPICIICPDDAKDILASLEELKRIHEAKMPEEPKIIGRLREVILDGEIAPLQRTMLQHIDTLKAYVLRMEGENEKLRKDAERYRYFKGHLHQPHAIAHFVKFNNWHPSDADYLKDLDAAIDNAMDAGRGK